jgi:hypothetical protein
MFNRIHGFKTKPSETTFSLVYHLRKRSMQRLLRFANSQETSKFFLQET